MKFNILLLRIFHFILHFTILLVWIFQYICFPIIWIRRHFWGVLPFNIWLNLLWHWDFKILVVFILGGFFLFFLTFLFWTTFLIYKIRINSFMFWTAFLVYNIRILIFMFWTAFFIYNLRIIIWMFWTLNLNFI